MCKGYQSFIIIITLTFLILGGCSKEIGDLEFENQEMRSRLVELELIVEEQHTQIEEHEKTYELRNILDIKSRQILSALNHGIFNEHEAALLHEDTKIEDDRLRFNFYSSSNEVLFFQNKLDFERVRQRFYYLDDQGMFITGYEVVNLTDDIEKNVDSRAILIFTFIEETNGWKLADIGIDR